MADPDDREFDLVLLGATGFVGRLTAGQVAQRAPAGTRIALAGRDVGRLEAVRAGLGEQAARWPLRVVDSGDDHGLAGLARSTTAVITTVGPYLRLGLPLVAACAAAGTSYVDLTGEVLFMRATIEAHDAQARRTGARIVHSCGFDSIPSDLGVHVLAGTAGALTDTTLVVTALSGGVSGGTIDSVRLQLARMRADAQARAVVADPYALSPDRANEPDLGPQGELMRPSHDAALGWLAPFVMAGCNTRVVRRSNALAGWSYGRGLRYREVMGTGSGPRGLARASAMTAAVGALAAGLSLGPTSALLSRVLPEPGEGPDTQRLRRGRLRIEIHARAVDGTRWVARVAADEDPGYAATSTWLAEAGLSAALDGPAGRLPSGGGVLTPASAFGGVLVARLRAAGLTLEVEQVRPA